MGHGPRLGTEAKAFLSDLGTAVRVGEARRDCEVRAALLSPDVLAVVKGGKRVRDVSHVSPEMLCDDSDDLTEDDGRPPLGDAPSAKRARMGNEESAAGRASQTSMVSDNEMALYSYRVSELRTDIEHCKKELKATSTEEQRRPIQQAIGRLEEQLNDVIQRIESNTAVGRSQTIDELSQ
eukprot:TRINITY_DN16304_c0_g1_i1.p2 TRINITY_DN16304_c0_g1~~TRINITY_DN16304_c0_g1_i1.p2  ORF type:complete len:180 (+),score=50.59 TRINITY_DN16304_c0_g1_i1:380-919(+)